MVVADIPAGRRLSEALSSRKLRLDPGTNPAPISPTTAPVAGNAGRPLLPLPFADAAADAAISLAGVHHLCRQAPAVPGRSCASPVRAGALFCRIVARGTATARFLDGFVGDSNSTGHAGIFLDDQTLV